MSLIKKREKPNYTYLIGLALFLFIFNPWTLVNLDPSPPLSFETLSQILILNLIVLFFLGFLIYYEAPAFNTFYVSALTILISCLIPLLSLEIFLRSTSLLDQVDSPHPSYIPKYMRDYDADIEKTGFITDEGFRTSEDIISLLRKLQEDKGCKVVVLGDSVIWGAGLEPDIRWPNKLSNHIRCNVYPFGKNGWTSIEQFGFYEKFLIKLDFDYLLIGIVENDPHPRGEFLNYSFEPEIYKRSNWGILQVFGMNAFHQTLSDLSYSYDYTSQLFAAIITPLIKTKGSLSDPPIWAPGYPEWRNRLYKNDVYSLWENVLSDFNKISNHSYGFVLTPTAGIESEKELWTKVDKTISQLDVPYVNLHEITFKTFQGKIRPRKNWANMADAHPGDVQTSLYAKGSVEVLRKLGYENEQNR